MLHKFRVLIPASLFALAAMAGISRAGEPQSATAVAFAVSKPVRELAPSLGNRRVEMHPRINPLAGESDRGARGTWTRGRAPLDPLALFSRNPASPTPPLDLEFDGLANPDACGGCSPPDTNGDAGTRHYVQIVNATKRNQRELIITWQAELAARVHGALPELSGAVLARVNKFLPDAGSDNESKIKGADSESAMTRNPITASNRIAARRLNERQSA